MYMNECMKLQSLLKVYGGTGNKKLFKGVKVTQTSGEQMLKFGAQRSGRQSKRSRDNSPLLTTTEKEKSPIRIKERLDVDE